VKSAFDLDYLRRSLDYEVSRLENSAKLDGTGSDRQQMVWVQSSSLSIMMIDGVVYDFDPAKTRVGYANTLKLIDHSLKVEEWRRWRHPGPKILRLKDPHERQRPDENGVWPEWGSPRPQAWVWPNLALIDHRWWQEGVIDQAEVASIFDRQEAWYGGSTLAGVDQAECLLSVGAYRLVEPLQHTVNAFASQPRDFEPADRLGLLLAGDPGQLHDPKSPVRKSARSIMRRNMESRWFMQSRGLMPFHWLRTFEWREGQSGLSPRETMLRAYAYMPDVEPPPGIAREVNQLRKIPI
jgi:hypothetical protein